MHLELTTLALLAGAVGSVAAVTPKRFSVPANRVRTSLQPRAQNQHQADSTNHVVVDFTFGGQKIPVAIDTGSTFTWTASTLDKNHQDTASLPTLYNPNISSTYHDENKPNDAYDCSGHGSTCFMGVDNVATAGLTANGMAFGVATQISQGVFASGQAATMGFGRQANAPSTWLPRDQTFWLRTGANLEMPYLFAVNIYQDRNGTFDFGFIDTAKYTGELTFVPMDTTQSNWNFQMNGFAIGKGSKQTVDKFAGVVDTGGPNLGLPSSVVDPYFKSFGGKATTGNSHTYPCSAYPPPNLTLYLEGGKKLVLNSTFLVDPPDGSGTTCNGRIDDSVQTGYNIGACVLDQKFVVFDHANSRIGFADKREAGQPAGVAPSPPGPSTKGPAASTTTGSTGNSASSTDASNPLSPSSSSMAASNTAAASNTSSTPTAASSTPTSSEADRMLTAGFHYIWPLIAIYALFCSL